MTLHEVEIRILVGIRGAGIACSRHHCQECCCMRETRANISLEFIGWGRFWVWRVCYHGQAGEEFVFGWYVSRVMFRLHIIATMSVLEF